MRGIVFSLIVSMLFSLGCVHVHHPAVEQTLYPCEPSPFRPSARNEVYLFMMNNFDITEQGNLLALRDRLAEYGFPKVAYTQQVDLAWYERELRRIHRDRPEARLLLLGYGSSTANIVKLAEDCLRDELPIDAVIFLDPSCYNADLRTCLNTTTVTIRSHNWQGSPRLLTQENYQLSGVGHLSAARSEQTFRIVSELMNRSAARVPRPPAELPRLSLPTRYRIPRERADVPLGVNPEWNFLQECPEFPTLPPSLESRNCENCPKK